MNCDWCRIAADLPGHHWHPNHCGPMTPEDVERLSVEARRIYYATR